MIRAKHVAAATVIAGCILGAGTASAVQPAVGLPSGVELPGGAKARSVRHVTSQPPRRATRAWRAFRAAHPGSWVGSFDAATGVPHRIFGQGVAAPGTSADPAKAAAFATELLKKHLGLLAPGATPSDFKLVSNETRGALRTVGFFQYEGGLRVLGGQLSFRFKNDRVILIASTAAPHVGAAVLTPAITHDLAAKQALGWIASDITSAGKVTTVEGPFVLPLYAGSSIIAVRTVLRVVVETAAPIARFDVFVDAETGELVAREQTLRFASGTVLFDAPERYPGAQRLDYPAKYVAAQVGGSAASADGLGSVSFTGSPAAVSVTATSAYVNVNNENGADVSTVLNVPDGGSAVWSLASDPDGDAQLNAFIHAQLVKDFTKQIAPDMSWIDASLPVNVNQNDVCNAFYDGSSINFYRQGQQCENTGRLADVVYHEFGHGFHHHAVILGAGDFDGALSEGVSDYLAATITGDPAMGRGFFYSSAPLRHIDDVDHVWPDDVVGEVHEDGLIIGGALWDLRKNLIAKHGESAGAALANHLYYVAMSNADDIPSMYPEVLAADDDDGDLANGTPNVCEISEAFSRHGLRSLLVEASPLAVEAPTQEGFEVTLHVEGLYAQCPGEAFESALIEWRLEDGPPGSGQTVAMTGGPTDFVGIIPTQSPGQVVRYRVELELSSSTLPMAFPDNPADEMYQFFVGTVTPIYCTDFESDPEAEGWTHGLLAGEMSEGADDWQWDTPNGSASNGDPSEAFSGDNVFGNDLGHENYNGFYQSDKVNYADSPIIDVSGHEHVRLQYRRWLQVEDGVFDDARIYANGQLAWDNLASSNQNDAERHHTDREWRFHDVDLRPYLDGDEMQIRFELASDGGLEMGGWTIDDFCVVAYEGEPETITECGNALLEIGESCDDGNTVDGDGCDADCEPETAGTGGGGGAAAAPVEEVVVTSGCGCQLPGQSRHGFAGWMALGLVGLLLRRRR